MTAEWLGIEPSTLRSLVQCRTYCATYDLCIYTGLSVHLVRCAALGLHSFFLQSIIQILNKLREVSEAFLWPSYEMGPTTIFLICGFFYLSSSFFCRLISAVADWMYTIVPHVVWP